MAKKEITINGMPCGHLFTDSYKVSYTKKRGKNTGMMQDGSYTDDVLKNEDGTSVIKAVINLVCMPLTAAQLREFLFISAEEYVDVNFYDPMHAAYRRAIMMPSDSTQKLSGVGSDGQEYWVGASLTLTER